MMRQITEFLHVMVTFRSLNALHLSSRNVFKNPKKRSHVCFPEAPRNLISPFQRACVWLRRSPETFQFLRRPLHCLKLHNTASGRISLCGVYIAARQEALPSEHVLHHRVKNNAKRSDVDSGPALCNNLLF